MRVRVVLTLLVWVQLTLVCQGHTRGHYHIGPHLVLGSEPHPIEDMAPLPDERYVGVEACDSLPFAPTPMSDQGPLGASAPVSLVGADLTEGTLSSIQSWVEPEALVSGPVKVQPTLATALMTLKSQIAVRPDPPPPRAPSA